VVFSRLPSRLESRTHFGAYAEGSSRFPFPSTGLLMDVSHTHRLKPLRNASRFLTLTCAELDPRNPITGIAACCARAPNDHATAPPSSVMTAARLPDE
jgi:hypothetical protein